MVNNKYTKWFIATLTLFCVGLILLGGFTALIDPYFHYHAPLDFVKYELKNESGILADFYKSTTGSYIVHCQIKEGDAPLIELNLSVPNEATAEQMCNNWKNTSEDIYAFVISQLRK